jgi:cellulose synthase (UDP-forming)
MLKQFVLRAVIVLTVIAGVNYVGWRWLFSLNPDALWIAIPLALAETHSLIEVALFGLTMWRLRKRVPPAGPLDQDLTVDVLITTVDEPTEMVVTTAQAAANIRYPHRTWILDDGNRPEIRDAADRLGVGYITRGVEWAGHPRHAKAGNVNNALMVTEGEFLLILDADQVPDAAILDRTLPYFADEQVALVQTPQHFGNVGKGDPLGGQTPLFYGPIQQGKDGWNAAFFCGSNAVLRREALMRLALEHYAADVDSDVRRALKRADGVVARAMATEDANPIMVAALAEIRTAIEQTRVAVEMGEPLGTATFRLQEAVDRISEDVVALDLHLLTVDLQTIEELDANNLTEGSWRVVPAPEFEAGTVQRLSPRSISPLGAVDTVQDLLRSIDVNRVGEAQALMPLATNSVTEDMATSMRLHAQGWKSVYHHEVLATGVAPVNIDTLFQQRLRWAQGTMQVMLQENPLTKRGLSIPQRLMYLSTMWSYLAGLPMLIFLIAPALYLLFGIMPVTSLGWDYVLRFVPFLLLSQLVFVVSAAGLTTWRQLQYNLALFPVWIHALGTAIANVWFKRPLSFSVTDKTGGSSRSTWRLLVPQISAATLLVIASVVGIARVMLGLADPIGTGVNLGWVVFDLVVLSVLVGAVRFSNAHTQGEAR